MLNPKSDVPAKEAFAEELRRRGYIEVRVTREPADITATMNGIHYYFELKFIGAENVYFGAATLTEWEAARMHAERYRFVVAYIHQSSWEFVEYTPKEFMQFSTIPPFKIFFNLPIRDGKATPSVRASRSVRLTWERLERMIMLFREFRGKR